MRNAQLVEIDLRSGIVTNESRAGIGARLLGATNAVWNYPYPRTETPAVGPWGLRQPLSFPTASPLTYTGIKSFRDLGFTGNSGFSNTRGVLVFGANTSDQYSAWVAETGGAEYAFSAVAPAPARATLPSTTTSILGCSVVWDTPGNDPKGGAALSAGVGMTVFSHRQINNVYYLLDDAASIRSLTTDTTNCPAGAAALAIHLDRLWLLKNGFLYYTDPLNADSIRTTNVLRVQGDGRCLIPGQLGQLDTSGVARLIIGTANGVQVLDGDPQLGGGLQADMRVLLDGIGMAHSHVAAVTPYGVYFLGTDGNLWWIPVGAQSARAVGTSVLPSLGINPGTLEIDQDSTACGSVVYLHPYLYIFPGGASDGFLTAEPSPDGIAAFWGPHSTFGDAGVQIMAAPIANTNTTQLAFHSPSSNYVSSLHTIGLLPTGSNAAYSSFDPRTTTAKTGRQPIIQTGLITVPGHKVRILRVIAQFQKQPQVSAADVTWLVRWFDDTGTERTCDLLPETAPTAGTNNPNAVVTLHYVPRDAVMTHGAGLTIYGTTGAHMGLVRLFAEIHTAPAQF